MAAANTAQFGISYQEAVTFARLEEAPVVCIAAIIQHNTSGFASIKEKGKGKRHSCYFRVLGV
ncbi:NMT1/THI5 like [Clostridium grantii DSM 8605]|uniref:NMT1/THI5 like n=1 Tax=Clostridium grantii DSM 8605 TaxID=1121316 RepID=A0A1M5X3W2_9CLOT|nr:NMT1/THI5 like [Clostridium grantii DSM 8605]